MTSYPVRGFGTFNDGTEGNSHIHSWQSVLTPWTADRADLDTQIGKPGHLLPVSKLARLMLGEYERIPLL